MVAQALGSASPVLARHAERARLRPLRLNRIFRFEMMEYWSDVKFLFWRIYSKSLTNLTKR